jgi:hypothetical protein
MKKTFLIIALAVSGAFMTAPVASAQNAFFTYTGVPTSPLMPGAVFTIGVTLDFTAGGQVTDLGGLSYWMYQQNPTAGFPLTITNRDVSGSQFNVLQSPFLVYPQILDPINRNPNGSQTDTDLGALGNPNVMNPSGTYFIANLTFSIGMNAAPGTYTVSNTTAQAPNVGGRISRINANNAQGTTAPINASPFSFTVVPEPSTYALLAFGGIGAAVMIYRRRSAVA